VVAFSRPPRDQGVSGFATASPARVEEWMGAVYVAFDGGKDKWAYAYMKGWKTNQRVDFDFEDAHDLDAMTGRAQNEQYVKSMLKERMKQSEALVVIVW